MTALVASIFSHDSTVQPQYVYRGLQGGENIATEYIVPGVRGRVSIE
jgi:hypothetical protein